MLQPGPRSAEGCNTLLHSSFANVITRERLLYRNCYIQCTFLSSSSTMQSQNNIQNFWPRALTSINTRLQKASITLKPAPDIVRCPFRLHGCLRYNHRTTFRNHSPRALTPIDGINPTEASSRHQTMLRHRETSIDCQ